MTLHWLGAGLSSVPGIRRLAEGPHPLVLWNRTVEKAHDAVAGLETQVDVRCFDEQALRAALQAGDIVISMLPGTFHPGIARLCLDKDAHFVSSSYINPDMQALHGEAGKKGLCLVNEVGLDPGLDHLMAHRLVYDYVHTEQYAADNQLYFRSYCGGFPATPNAFRYKFSWSPLGVLRALKSPSRSIRKGKVLDVERPWQAITAYSARLPGGRSERFEAYPNRDALPFMKEYGFNKDWQVEEFVRGTLRLDGWAEAWADIFAELEHLEGEAGEQRLQALSDELLATESYEEGEADRVVLCVELEARNDDRSVWHHGMSIDARGNERGSAMARLVSLTVSLAVEGVTKGEFRPGVSSAPSDPMIIDAWFDTLTRLEEHIEYV